MFLLKNLPLPAYCSLPSRSQFEGNQAFSQNPAQPLLTQETAPVRAAVALTSLPFLSSHVFPAAENFGTVEAD